MDKTFFVILFFLYIILDDEPPEDETPSDKLRDMLFGENEESPVIMPFSGFRERIQAEKSAKNINDDSAPRLIIDKEKKSFIPGENEPNMPLADEERVGAHFRKLKLKAPPFTAEYITTNRLSPLDEEIRSNAYKNYIQSFAEKQFPFEYENPSEITEPRVYMDEDGVEESPIDAGSGEIDSYHLKGIFF